MGEKTTNETKEIISKQPIYCKILLLQPRDQRLEHTCFWCQHILLRIYLFNSVEWCHENYDIGYTTSDKFHSLGD